MVGHRSNIPHVPNVPNCPGFRDFLGHLSRPISVSPLPELLYASFPPKARWAKRDIVGHSVPGWDTDGDIFEPGARSQESAAKTDLRYSVLSSLLTRPQHSVLSTQSSPCA